MEERGPKTPGAVLRLLRGITGELLASGVGAWRARTIPPNQNANGMRGQIVFRPPMETFTSILRQGAHHGQPFQV